MTLDQFKSKYLGKQVEYHSYDPAAKYQCVDLVNQYIVEVLKLTPVIGTHAKDFPTKIDTKQFEVIKNTQDFKPLKGDIAIWNGKAGGGYGHIAVVIDDKATLYKFSSLDQNYSEALFVTLESHSYTNVSHFLRAKLSVTPPPMPDNLSDFLAHNKVKTLSEMQEMHDEQVKFLADERVKTGGLEQTVRDAKKSHNDFVQKILGILNPFGNPLGLSDEELVIRSVTEVVSSTSQLEIKLADREKEARATEAKLKIENEVLKSQVEKLQDQLNDLKEKHEKEIDTMQKRIDKVQTSLETHNDKQDDFETLKGLIKPLLDIFKEWYGKTKQKVQSKQK